MLKVIPMSNPEEQQRVCKESGVQYDKNQFAYAIYEDDKVIGASQFYIKNDVGYLSDLKIKDDSLPHAMLLGRSVLNFLDLHGVKEAYFEKRGENYDKQAKAIGFKDKSGNWYAYLDGMFTAEHH